MSGVCAIVNFDGAPVDPRLLQKMAEQCSYRGPDGIHYWIQGNVGLAYLALNSTPEALRENQPLLSSDGKACLAADVRIDNRPELISLLNSKGTPIQADATDADLVLAAYQLWGESCAAQIIGDFAFAIWDAGKQRMVCARDIYGVKSLHYARVGSTFCVASEAQQILQHPAVHRALDEISIADFLVGNYNDEGRTMFQDVWAVQRACYIVADSTGQRMARYWDIDPKVRIVYKTDEEYAAHFLEIFERSVADRLRTQGGTVGITMSGGMDSTSVAAVAQRIINHHPGAPHLLACSYAFEQLKECDETYYSQAVANEQGLDLIYVPAENFWYLDDDESFTPSLETPFMIEESIMQHMLNIFKERGACVFLSGHGGDNLVAGSPFVCADQLVRGDLRSFVGISKLLRDMNIPFSRRLQIYIGWFLKPLVPKHIRKSIRKMRKLDVPDWLDENFAHRTHVLERLYDSKTPPQFRERARQENYESSVKIDALQMSISAIERRGAISHLEPRHPFLDRRLVEYLMAIPPEQTFRMGVSKYILREAMRGILPEAVRNRLDKTEFSRYTSLGLRFYEVKKVQPLFQSSMHLELKLVYLSKLQGMYEDYLSKGHPSHAIHLWRIISLELWLRKFYYQLFGGES